MFKSVFKLFFCCDSDIHPLFFLFSPLFFSMNTDKMTATEKKPIRYSIDMYPTVSALLSNENQSVG